MTWDETPCLTDVGVEALVVPDSRSCRYGSCTTRLGILINAFSSVLSSASSQFSDPKLLRDAYVVGSTGSSSVAYAFLFHVGWCSLGPLTFDFPERSRDCLGSVATRSYCLADMTASNVVACAGEMGVDRLVALHAPSVEDCLAFTVYIQSYDDLASGSGRRGSTSNELSHRYGGTVGRPWRGEVRICRLLTGIVQNVVLSRLRVHVCTGMRSR